MTPGTILGDRYRLERKLGEGGMGAVWAATHVVTRKAVAIKLLKLELAGNAGLVERFMREARAACAVNHPHVVQIHDVLQLPGGAPVMVMDLLDGESLGERLQREGRIPVDEFSRIMLQVISAVGAAHAARVVHRDLKPDNLFLSRTQDGSVDLKVLDFGIAKVSTTDAEAGVLTKTGSMLGTPFYMSPEQLFGEKDIDGRADIWSLGIIVYECLSGKRPTEADNLGQIIKVVTSTGIAPLETVAPHVPLELCAVVRRMLTSDRSARLDDLAEARVVFERYAGMPGSAPPPARLDAPSANVRIVSDVPPGTTGALHWAATQPAEPPMTVPRRRGTLPAVALAVALAVVGVVGVVGGGVVVFPRLLASRATHPSGDSSERVSATPPPSASDVPPQPSVTAPSAVPPSDSSAATVDGAAPRADSSVPLMAAARSSANRIPVKQAPSASPSVSHVSVPTSTPSQSVLVEKPPF